MQGTTKNQKQKMQQYLKWIFLSKEEIYLPKIFLLAKDVTSNCSSMPLSSTTAASENLTIYLYAT